MKEMFAFMPTIGKIIEESLPSLTIAWICARIPQNPKTPMISSDLIG
jgi:hypothetical protein